MFSCSAMLLAVSRRFARAFWWTFVIFSSVLLVSGRSDLSSSVTLFSSLRKTFHPLVNCCFLHSNNPVNLHQHHQLTTRNLMFARCSNSSSDILATAHQTHSDSNRCHAEGDCHRSRTTATTTTTTTQQQHNCETLICQLHQTILRHLSSAATASKRWRVLELYCPPTYFQTIGVEVSSI